MCSQDVSLTGKDGGVLISKVTINLLLKEAANATVAALSQMWITDDVYSQYIDVAVCSNVFKLFAAPLLGTLGWHHEIHNVTKMLLRNEICDLFGILRCTETQKERISYLHRGGRLKSLLRTVQCCVRPRYVLPFMTSCTEYRRH